MTLEGDPIPDTDGTQYRLGKVSVVAATNLNAAVAGLLLEMALETEGGVAGAQHFGIYRSVRQMAGRAPFTSRLVLEHVRSPLCLVAFETFVIERGQVHATKGNGRTLVRVVAVDAGDLAIDHRVGVLKAELAALVEVAVETNIARTSRIDDLERRSRSPAP